ncbi:MAG: putative Ig domain-containing protein, partial [Bdellovibrionales bacterium]|nr:putative Ig domain-containing protein [Bdellovibrionales bacterium]
MSDNKGVSVLLAFARKIFVRPKLGRATLVASMGVLFAQLSACTPQILGERPSAKKSRIARENAKATVPRWNPAASFTNLQALGVEWELTSEEIAGVRVEFHSGPGCVNDLNVPVSLSGPARSASFSSLADGTYSFRVIVKTQNGRENESSCSEVIEVDTQAPAQASALSWQGGGTSAQTTITPRWNKSTSTDLLEQRVRIFQGSACGGSAVSNQTLASTVETSSFIGIDGATYSFSITSKDFAGNESVVCSGPVLVSVGSTPTPTPTPVPELSYSGATGTSGSVGALMTVSPTTLNSNGSAITSCGIKSGTTALPAWATVDPSTCVISGTPTGTLSSTTYTLVATNSAGTSADASVTLEVAAAASQMNTQIAAGGAHTCAIQNGAVLCWGDNSLGQLGDGTTTNSAIPVQVPGLDSNVTSLAAGAYHTCAIQNGALKCWGDNSSGQLGDGTTTDRLTPVAVPGLDSNVTSLAAGYYHTCAIQNGALKCWGGNYAGQLGDGTTTNSAIPVQVPGLDSNVTSLAAGYFHTCAIQNGAVLCWGYNYSGQLGDGTTTDRLTPVAVPGLDSNVTSLAAGVYHTCAIQNGALKCWG